MKNSIWLTQKTKYVVRMLIITTMLGWTACSVESVNPVGPSKANKLKVSDQSEANEANPNSQSSAGDYSINVSKDGAVWTYCITKNPGAKGLSHFILNLQNCGTRSVTISNILWATVNGQPATLETSEGNTGCDVSEVTTNFVKFDDLPDANSYTIKFELSQVFGNFVNTTAWLKAGTSCYPYTVNAPCCPQ